LVQKLANEGTAYVPFFPLGGFTPLQSSALSEVALQFDATPMQVALAWLLQRSANLLLIPGTSSVEHLRRNLAAAELRLPSDAAARLEAARGDGRSAARGRVAALKLCLNIAVVCCSPSCGNHSARSWASSGCR